MTRGTRRGVTQNGVRLALSEAGAMKRAEVRRQERSRGVRRKLSVRLVRKVTRRSRMEVRSGQRFGPRRNRSERLSISRGKASVGILSVRSPLGASSLPITWKSRGAWHCHPQSHVQATTIDWSVASLITDGCGVHVKARKVMPQYGQRMWSD